MAKFKRIGTVTRGHYSGGEWCTRDTVIIAEADTKKNLQIEVDRLTKEKSSIGHTIDFGYVSGSSAIKWDSEILKVV